MRTKRMPMSVHREIGENLEAMADYIEALYDMLDVYDEQKGRSGALCRTTQRQLMALRSTLHADMLADHKENKIGEYDKVYFKRGFRKILNSIKGEVK